MINALYSLRETLTPGLKARFSLISSNIGKLRVVFFFPTHEHAICGATAVTEHCRQNQLPVRVVTADDGPLVFVYPIGGVV